MIFDKETYLKTFKMRFKICCSLAMCLIALTTTGNQINHLFTKSQTKTIEANYEFFKAQKTEQQFSYSIDLGNYGNYELQLTSNSLFASNLKKELQQADALPLTFSGKIAGQPKSQVAITVNHNFISGYVHNGKTTTYFEPLRHFDATANAKTTLIYKEQDVLNEKLHCTHNHQPLCVKVAQQKQMAKKMACDEYTVELVLVADYGMFQKYGSAAAVRNLITTAVNAARLNYDTEFNDPIIFKIVDEYIATSAEEDLWDVTETNARNLLDEFATTNFTNEVYDLASLWVAREIWEIRDGERRVLAGLAYDRGLCRNTQKYNLISVNNSTEEYLVTVFSHEVGHNFSAGHDADGTEFIMSEGELSSTWSPASLNKINSFYPNTNCLCNSEFVDFDVKSFCLSLGGEDDLSKVPTIENIGNTASPVTKVGLFLSTDNNITVDDYLVRTVELSALQPGQSKNATILLDFDNVDLPGGDYYYGIIADAENNIIEGDETNNVGCTGMTTLENPLPTNPDLTIENCASISITNNSINTGSFSVKNIGNATATSTLLGVYLSANTIIDDNDYLIIQSAYTNLAPNSSLSRTLARNISAINPPIPAGTYYIGFLADRANALTELNENNNTCYDASPRFTVTYACKDANAHNYNPNATYGDASLCQTCDDGILNGDEERIDCGGSCAVCPPQGADLTIENCASISITNNSINTGNFSIKNIGNVTATSTLLGVYLSANTIIDDNDYLIIQSAYTNLAPNSSISRTLARNISEVNPPIPAGTYYVGFLADRANALTELNENNNTCYDASPRFTVTYGCKDVNAHNYNPNATYGDASLCQTCDDNIKNGDEDEVDCGGSCPLTCEVENPNTCQQTDRAALIALYNSTDGANWTNPWNLNEAIENWYGITLNQDGCVESIYFFNNNLNGSLPEEIGKLSELKWLQLRYNGISGAIPGSIGELSKLQTLELSINKFEGNIPASIGNLSNLRYLSLGSNKLTGNLPVALGNLSNLETLSLYANQLSGSIPAELSNLSNLKNLYLYSNAFIGSIPSSLGKLEKLQNLHLAANQLDGYIPYTLGNLSNLKKLNLYSNQLSGSIPLQFGCLSNLEEISLNNNQLSGTIPAELGDLQNLTSLYMGRNNLSGCFNGHLKNLCNVRVDVNYGNNFYKQWDSFCANGNEGICQPEACLFNDANTLLNLSFDETLTGVNGERPLNYKGLKYDNLAIRNKSLNIQSNYFDDEMKLTFPAAGNINLSEGTIEAWVMHFWDGDDPATHTLLQYGAAGGLLFFKDGANNFRLILNRWSPAGFPEIGVGTNTQFWESGQWKHVAATWGNGEIILYIDGEIADRNTYAQPIYTITDTYFSIGSEAGNFTWGGLIDQLRISNKVRTETEMNAYRFACTGSDRIKQTKTIETKNYPNPFNSTTTIAFDLPDKKPVTLFVTDIMGKQIDLLINNKQLSKGTHNITFDGNKYPNGIYYYTLKSGDYEATQKMILIR